MSRLISPAVLLAACSGAGSVPLPQDCTTPTVTPDVITWEMAHFDDIQPQSVVLAQPCEDQPELRVYDVRIDGDPLFAVPTDVTTIPAGGSEPITIRYVPDNYGPHAAQVVLDTSAGELRVSVVGRPDPDQDGDGVNAMEAGGEDCDDQDPTIGTPSDEETNLIDDDCDGFVDEHALQAGDVLIAELMLRPQEARVELGQWIEVRNTTDRDIDMLNWRIEGNAGVLRIEDSTVVPAGRLVVLGVSDDTTVNGGVQVDGLLTGPGTPLAERSWSMTLIADSFVVAELERLAWPDPFGASISLDPIVDDAFRATLIDYWCESDTPLASGDRGTPGQPNDRCDTVDHDGDGRTVAEGDCDDDDKSVAPGKRELWDGKDNDCNGTPDMMWADDIDLGHLDGARYEYLGADGAGALGDLDGDGKVEIFVGQGAYSAGAVFAVQQDSLRGGSGLLSAEVHHTWRDDSGTATLAGVAPSLGDADGDGDDDLMLVTRSRYGGTDLAWLVDDLPPSTSDAAGRGDVQAVVMSGGDGTVTSYNVNGAIIDVDLDGDGSPDPVVADASWAPDGVSTTSHGQVYVLDLDHASGEIAAPDVAEAAWQGEPYAGLGMRMFGGDVDDDGYDDLIIRDGDPRSLLDTQGLHVVPGGASLADDGPVTDAALVSITNLAKRDYRASTSVPGTVLYDADEDGDNDLVVGDPTAERVLLFRDAADLSGLVDADADFDLQIEGKGMLGQDLDVADINDDGVMKLVVGAPDFTTTRGLVYLFGPDLLAADGSLESGKAEVILWGDLSRDGFGDSVLIGDLGGDPGVDLVVAAPRHGTGFTGRLWLFEREE